MTSADSVSVPNGVGYGEGCPLSSRLGGLGERRELPSGCRKRILAYFEDHRTLFFVYDKNLRGIICTSVPYSKLWGTCPPRPPVIYAHASTHVHSTTVKQPLKRRLELGCSRPTHVT